MKLFGKSKEAKNPDGQPVTGDQAAETKMTETTDSSKSHPELKLISGQQISQASSTPNQQPVKPAPKQPLVPDVKYVVAVASGKGGVGKSTVSANLAVALSQMGLKVGLMDADVYGPSIPTMMGIKQQPQVTEQRQLLPINQHGLSLMSIGFMVPDEQAMIWRGPMLHSAMQQFLGDVIWGELDYLLVDMPPGTGDAQLSLSQIIPLSGTIIVTTPQDVALADVRRSIAMADRMETPLLGIVENMSYYINPSNNEKVNIFGSGGGEKICQQLDVPLLGQIPIDPKICDCGDLGTPIVLAFPDSPQSISFKRMANQLIVLVEQLEQEDELTIQ